MARLRITFILALLVVPLFLFCLRPGALAQQPTVNIAVMQVTGEGPFYIALEKGYFKEAGVGIKIHPFGSSSQAMGPLAGNELQVVIAGGINPAMYNAVVRGIPIVVALGGNNVTIDHEADWFMLRPDLKEEIKGIKDLKGRKVAINAPVSPMLYVLGKALAKEGLGLKDVDVKFINFPDMAVAFQRKAVDASIQVEPTATLEAAKGFSLKWKGTAETIGPFQVSAVLFNADWAKANREVAINFLLAMIRGAREYYTADRRAPNRAEVINIMAKHTRLKDPKLFDQVSWGYIDPNGRVNMESLREQQDWWHEQGQVPAKAPMDRVVDFSYAEAALKKLGEYKER